MIILFINCDIITGVIIYVGLSAPKNVRATVLSHSSVKVTWNQSCDATQYIISYSTNASDISGESVTVKGGNTTSHTLTHLEENTTYTITVQAALGDNRKSALSSKVSVRTHAAGKPNKLYKME